MASSVCQYSRTTPTGGDRTQMSATLSRAVPAYGFLEIFRRLCWALFFLQNFPVPEAGPYFLILFRCLRRAFAFFLFTHIFF